MRLDRDRPEILTPPENPPACCTRQTITVPPQVIAKTAQKHDYPSAAHRRSYARRTGAERGFATAKDPASNDISRGWCRLMGLTPLTLAITCLLVVRNQRILQAWDARQEENESRAAKGLPPKTRRRRRKHPRQPRHRTALTTQPDDTRPPHPSPAPRSPPACPEPGHTAPKPTRQARNHTAATTTAECLPECQTQT